MFGIFFSFVLFVSFTCQAFKTNSNSRISINNVMFECDCECNAWNYSKCECFFESENEWISHFQNSNQPRLLTDKSPKWAGKSSSNHLELIQFFLICTACSVSLRCSKLCKEMKKNRSSESAEREKTSRNILRNWNVCVHPLSEP